MCSQSGLQHEPGFLLRSVSMLIGDWVQGPDSFAFSPLAYSIHFVLFQTDEMGSHYIDVLGAIGSMTIGYKANLKFLNPLNMQRLRSEGKTPAEIKSATKELKAVLSLGGAPKQMATKTLKNKAITKSATS